ncbi:hypothetical protein AKO1_007714 [Acrasis kona]|uniref:Uncharacterized protein n=1 Tax=Acrasis kona TaxID=1008807 RepID=A0AAW2YTV5_9EUKA
MNDKIEQLEKSHADLLQNKKSLEAQISELDEILIENRAEIEIKKSTRVDAEEERDIVMVQHLAGEIKILEEETARTQNNLDQIHIVKNIVEAELEGTSKLLVELKS